MMSFNFSDRFNEIGLGEDENNLTKIKKEKMEAGIAVLDMINSNPTSVGISFPSHIITHNLEQQINAIYEPSASGFLGTRIAISEYYKAKNIEIDPDDLILTASTSESYSFLFKLLTNPGDEVLIPSPGYPLFHFLTQFENVKAVEYELEEKEEGKWFYSIDHLKHLVTSKTKAVVLVSPSNPTGAFLSRADWNEWLEWSSQNQIPLLIDEVFAPYFFSHESDYAYPISNHAPIFVLNGISKMIALPQWKLGWIHILGENSFKEKAKAGLELIADTYLSVNSPIQRLLPELLKWSSMIHNQINNRIRRNLSQASSVFSEHTEIKWNHGTAGWYGWLEITKTEYDSSEEIAEQLLREKNLYTHPGDWYGFDPERRILVLSLILPEDQFFGGIKELMSFLRYSKISDF